MSAFAAPAPRVAAQPSITIAAARRMHAVSERPRFLRPPSPAPSPRIDAGALPSGAVERGFDCAPQGAQGREPGGQLELGQYPRLGSARLGSARLGSARLGSARLGSARLGSARLGSARLGSARLGSARLGSARCTARLRRDPCGSIELYFLPHRHLQAHSRTLPYHSMVAGRAAAAPVASHAYAARSPRPKPRSHWGGTRARRTPVPGTPARTPAPRGRTAGGWKATARNRSINRMVTLPVAPRSGRGLDRLARCESVAGALRDPPRPRAALGQGHDFAYPMYPSRHFRFVREYHHIVFLIQYFGIKCRVPADERSGCVYRTDRNGPIASMGPRTDPPETGENAARGRGVAGERARPGRLTAGQQVLGAHGAGEQARAHEVGAARP